MLHLLGNLCLVGWQGEVVATTTEVAYVVILRGELRLCRELVVAAEAYCLRLDVCDVGDPLAAGDSELLP